MASDSGLRTRLTRNEIIVSSVGNTVLFAIKLVVGIQSSSVAVIADAWHTLSDSLTSLIILIGSVVARRPADEKRPFGYGRAEIISSTLIGTILIAVGIGFARESIVSLIHKRSSDYTWTVFLIMIASAVAKELMAQYAYWTARKTGLLSLKADAVHHRMDAVSSLIIAPAYFLSPYIPQIDALLGLLVAGLIIFSAIDLLKQCFSLLLGESVSEARKAEIKEIAKEYGFAAEKLHHFHTHKYGAHEEITFHARLPGTMPLMEAHLRVSVLEKAIEAGAPDLFVTIHIESD